MGRKRFEKLSLLTSIDESSVVCWRSGSEGERDGRKGKEAKGQLLLRVRRDQSQERTQPERL